LGAQVRVPDPPNAKVKNPMMQIIKSFFLTGLTIGIGGVSALVILTVAQDGFAGISDLMLPMLIACGSTAQLWLR
jgi:hypothetical protein